MQWGAAPADWVISPAQQNRTTQYLHRTTGGTVSRLETFLPVSFFVTRARARTHAALTAALRPLPPAWFPGAAKPMTLSDDDALREHYELRRRLGQLRVRAAREGSEASPQLLIEIRDLEQQLEANALPFVTEMPMQQPTVYQGAPTRYEFAQLQTQVNRITLVLIIATVALVLSIAAFIMVLIILVNFR